MYSTIRAARKSRRIRLLMQLVQFPEADALFLTSNNKPLHVPDCTHLIACDGVSVSASNTVLFRTVKQYIRVQWSSKRTAKATSVCSKATTTPQYNIVRYSRSVANTDCLFRAGRPLFVDYIDSQLKFSSAPFSVSSVRFCSTVQ